MPHLLPDIVVSDGRPLTGHAVTISGGRITAIDTVAAGEETSAEFVRLPGRAVT